MATKVEVEVEVKSSADQFWAALLDSAHLFPIIFPNLYTSIQILEGDGKSAGSIRLITYAPGVQCLTFEKTKIDAVDNEKKLATYTTIGGEILNYYKSFSPTLAVASKGDGGAVVSWSVEYEKLEEDAPGAGTINDLAVQTFQGLDAYLLNN